MILLKQTRSKGSSCNCYIRLTGIFKGHLKIEKGKGHLRQISNHIDASNGICAASTITQLPSIQQVSKDSIKSIQICDQCFQKIGKSIKHSCGNSVKATQNVMKIVQKLPEKHQEQIVTSILKQKTDM